MQYGINRTRGVSTFAKDGQSQTVFGAADPGHWKDDAGSVTAEYAIATMAAVGFAGLLVVILKGDEVKGILTELVRRALSVG